MCVMTDHRRQRWKFFRRVFSPWWIAARDAAETQTTTEVIRTFHPPIDLKKKKKSFSFFCFSSGGTKQIKSSGAKKIASSSSGGPIEFMERPESTDLIRAMDSSNGRIRNSCERNWNCSPSQSRQKWTDQTTTSTTATSRIALRSFHRCLNLTWLLLPVKERKRNFPNSIFFLLLDGYKNNIYVWRFDGKLLDFWIRKRLSSDSI